MLVTFARDDFDLSMKSGVGFSIHNFGIIVALINVPLINDNYEGINLQRENRTELS